MKKLKIINNVLDKKNAETLKSIMTQSPEFAWFFNDGVSKVYDGHIQFLHHFYKDWRVNSDWLNMLDPLIKILNPLALIRIKANLLVRTPKIIEHGMHIDQPVKGTKNVKSAIYYVNTNNGYTRFENGKKISSKENKLIIFDNDQPHTGSTCTDERVRVVINFNYVER